jgi:NADH dehydrogenase [ubiquinone] 1 alpha subcomplex assembly factor 1
MQDGAAMRMVIVSFGPGQVPWHNLSDPIMGGVSYAQMLLADGAGIFTGVLSLEQGGGFASVRSDEGHHNLEKFDGLVVRARGDGKRYGFRLRTTTTLHGVNFQVDLQPGHAWNDYWFAFSEFQPVFRGRPAVGQSPLDPANIKTFGLIIAQRQSGPFRMEIESIAGYQGSAG